MIVKVIEYDMNIQQLNKQISYQMYSQMKRANLHDPMLPVISASRVGHKPIKDILKDLKQRKMVIQQRIRTQWEESDQEDRDESELHVRDRIITEVPYYIKHKQLHKKYDNQSATHMNNSYKVHQYTEQQSSERDSHLKTGNRKHKSILQFAPIQSQKKQMPVPPPKTRKQILRQVENILVNVPIDPRDRTQENISQLKNYLMQNNMFFAKIHNILAICLLKLNRLVWVDKHQSIYRMGQQRNAFFIILCGRLKLYNVQMHLKKVYKVCGAGQTVGEQLIFSTNPRKIVLESAKAMSKCLLVQIKIDNYKKMCQQMIRFGYKVNFNEMQSIIKRNFITKNWQRSEKARLQKLQKAN